MEAVRVVFVLVFLTSVFAQECQPSTLEYDCMLSPTDYYTLHWTLAGNDLHVAMEGRGAEWVGFAFTQKAGKMFPADAVIGWTDVNGAVVAPYRITTTSVFSEDEDFAVNLRNVLATQDKEKTTVYFSRSLIGGRVRVNPKAETDINYAIGDTDFLRYHSDNRGSAKIVLAAIPKGGIRKEFVSPLLRLQSPAPAPQISPVPAPITQGTKTNETTAVTIIPVEIPVEAPEEALSPESEEALSLGPDSEEALEPDNEEALGPDNEEALGPETEERMAMELDNLL